ncbi:DUF2487 family protein [Bacillaceae bacterium Marseille-Q3522]|nr:DUF2487 family protein [Bacillaceae bacterium Marseille-Q3522]
MKFIAEDMNLYLQAKEYVDTAILPLLPVELEEKNAVQSAQMNEYTALITSMLEKQFKGRLLLLPGFSYLPAEAIESQVERLQKWERILTENRFTYIFHITADHNWRKMDRKLKGTLIWLPFLPITSLKTEEKHKLLDQYMQVFMQEWQR